jgi:hypothetical protein
VPDTFTGRGEDGEGGGDGDGGGGGDRVGGGERGDGEGGGGGDRDGGDSRLAVDSLVTFPMFTLRVITVAPMLTLTLPPPPELLPYPPPSS